jgi:tRNA-splicing ligase RtcB
MRFLDSQRKLAVWASDVDEKTIEQAMRTSRMPFIVDYVALMPDAHFGLGSTVGSVIPTKGAVIPAAIGVDIGCGMIAANTGLAAYQLPDDLGPLMSQIEQRIPAGVGKGHIVGNCQVIPLALVNTQTFLGLDGKMRDSAHMQMGSLGSGNHFVEVCLDEEDAVWIVLHSGSRGIGNKLAVHHIDIAKGLMKDYFITLEDKELSYLVEGTPQFDAYITDMLWAQDYALANREAMMKQALHALAMVCAPICINPAEVINCHHNFTQRENVHGKNVWLTRKGAISARTGQLGVIPGSMGTASYIVRGLGSEAGLQSCSHGAGRRMSRTQARRELTANGLCEAMAGKTWNADKAKELVDESPAAYKPIDRVMADQADLVEVVHTLHQVLNYKGTS